uniref:C-type natriuretic peptide n=1 Tax=Geotria australis TaxID=71168 RepID=Q402A1_9VERT|nr:C-type natriuretic peptide [Geotria australis]
MRRQVLVMVVMVVVMVVMSGKSVTAKPVASYELLDDTNSEPWEGGSLLPSLPSQGEGDSHPLSAEGGPWERGSGPQRSSRGIGGGSQVSGEVWQRLFNDFVSNQRRFRGRTKKGKGCFGVKLDRIGSMSGLGC